MLPKKTFLFFCLSLLLLFVSFLVKSPNPSPITPPPTASPVPTLPQTTLLAVGDIMLGRHCQVETLKSQNPLYPFLQIADFTQAADLTFANLESPFFPNCPSSSTGMVFCSQPQLLAGLKFAGFDVLSLANNHALNYGQEGLNYTQNLLLENQFLPLLEGSLVTKEVGQIKFGFLAFDLTANPGKEILAQTKLASSQTDILILSLHWGNEYQPEPSPWQIKLARQLISSGAKVILGHHPHVIQPIENYQGGLIFYSLGNFVFDQTWSEPTQKSLAAKIIFRGKTLHSYQTFPVRIQKYCQPFLLEKKTN